MGEAEAITTPLPKRIETLARLLLVSAALLNVSVFQSPGAAVEPCTSFDEVITMRFAAVPCADKFPATVSDAALPISTCTPASIVSRALAATVTSPLSTYGEFAADHCVF